MCPPRLGATRFPMVMGDDQAEASRGDRRLEVVQVVVVAAEDDVQVPPAIDGDRGQVVRIRRLVSRPSLTVSGG